MSDETTGPRILPNAIYLLLNSVGRAALGATVVKGLGQEWIEALQGYVDQNGKFSKFEVLYSPVAVPPVFWEYNCGECWAFEREAMTCKWVDEAGFPNPGKIHPQGWCSVWMPLEGKKPLGWMGKPPWFLREPHPEFP